MLLLPLLLLLLILNMQNKKYTIHFFSQSLMTSCVASPQAAIVEHGALRFHKSHGSPGKKI